jgi:hypothetical protein
MHIAAPLALPRATWSTKVHGRPDYLAKIEASHQTRYAATDVGPNDSAFRFANSRTVVG